MVPKTGASKSVPKTGYIWRTEQVPKMGVALQETKAAGRRCNVHGGEPERSTRRGDRLLTFNVRNGAASDPTARTASNVAFVAGFGSGIALAG